MRENTPFELPEPVIVTPLFPPLLDDLLSLLSQLDEQDWEQATACPGWDVHALTCHLLGGDVGILSRRRDHYRPDEAEIHSWDNLVTLINRLNEEWVQATRRLSPRLLCWLLGQTGEQVNRYFSELDPYQIGEPVSWAGEEPAPVWLDLAREFTERWLHQQQIREAVAVETFPRSRYLAPVLATYVHSLPHAYRDLASPKGTTIVFHITGPAGGTWALLRETEHWQLYTGGPAQATAEITLSQDTAWRLFSRGLSADEIRQRMENSGPATLAEPLYKAVAIIA